MPRKLLAAPILVALVALAAGVRAGDAPRGSVLAIGGGKLDDAIIEKIVHLSCSDEGRRLVVCPAASGSVDGPEAAIFRSHGAKDVVVVDFRSREEADAPERAAALEGAGGYFFTGGDQNRLLASLRGTRALEVVKAAHRKGALVAGTSAGCAVLGALTILGGDVADIASAAVPIGEGFDFIPAIVDQHFLARHRHNRLVAALLAVGSGAGDPADGAVIAPRQRHAVGVGVDESTAVLREGDGPFEVVGRGFVSLYVPSSQGGRSFTLRLLAPGERFELR